MTFSLVGRCARTGALGVATTTSGLAVGARVPHAEAGVGAVASQHRTDPRLGPRGLALLRQGVSPEEAVRALLPQADAADEWLQLALMDAAGRWAVFHGARVKPERGHAGGEGCVALGNILASASVPAAMLRAFAEATAETLPERLLRGLEAGLEAGGEHSPLVSAALLVADAGELPLCDLRVDLADAPLAALRELWRRYEPEAAPVRRRALDPVSCGP